MNIGDKVRSLSGKEEGIITRFLADKMVEVEIEDGFEIPFSIRDLVVISNLENEYFRTSQEPESNSAKLQSSTSQKPKLKPAEKGIFLLFEAFNDKLYDVYVANNTDLKIAVSIGHSLDGAYQGSFLGMIEPRSASKTHQLNMDKFERWGKFICHIIYHQEHAIQPKMPIIKDFKLKAEAFFKAKVKEAPVRGGTAHVIQLDGDGSHAPTPETKTLTPQMIVENMLTSNEPLEILTAKVGSPSKRQQSKDIDLHIEKLRRDHLEIPKNEMLDIQLDFFEKALDQAILEGLDEVTFIHGTGAGTLRRIIQKRLSKNQHVAYHQDAQKEKFGYGATTAKLK